MPKRRDDGLILLIFLILAVILVFVFSFVNRAPIERKVMGIRFIVGENPGFDLNTSEIIFGRVPPGGGSFRKIKIDNQNNFTVAVRAVIDRNISRFVSIETPIVIPPGEAAMAAVSLNVPQGTKFGSYKGDVTFEIRKK